MEKIKTIVLGASGYTGIELLRILCSHPAVELVGITSRANAGKELAEVLPRFRGMESASLPFIEPDIEQIVATGAKVAFLALPHGKAASYAVPLLEAGLKVIDLSADFRLNSSAIYEEFYGEAHPAPEWLSDAVYGLPEVYRNRIKEARLIASPGCYPTSILLPLLPLLSAKLVDPASIVVSSMSGVSGAGRTASIPLLFAEVNESLRAYGLPKHRHLSEIEQELSLAAEQEVKITFVPHLVPVTRGIHSMTAVNLLGSVAEIEKAYEVAYSECPFVRLLGLGGAADTANVTRTNFVDIGWHHDSRTERLIVTSAEDNLTKGAAGQAVQSFNILNDFDEGLGLLIV